MRVRIGRRTILAVALLFGSAIRADAAEDLIGIWSAEARTRGGLGGQIIFTATEAISTFGALIDFKYEIAGNRIRFVQDPARPEASPLMEFTIAGDQLTLAQGLDGRPLVMTRTGAPFAGAHPIVGDWTYPHPAGAPAIQRFARNGAAQLRVVMQTVKGPYRTEKDSVTLQFQGRPPVKASFRREGNVLTLTNPDGKAFRYSKFEY
jgi:hypothetical protein